MIYTTLNKIRAHTPCHDGWRKLLSSLGKTSADDEPLSLVTILDSNGLDDALWCLRTLPEHDHLWRRMLVMYARRVSHLMTERSLDALDVADRYSQGLASDAELAETKAEAWAAAREAAEAVEAERAAQEVILRSIVENGEVVK